MRLVMIGMNDHLERCALRERVVGAGELLQAKPVRYEFARPDAPVCDEGRNVGHLADIGADTHEVQLVKDHALDRQLHGFERDADDRASAPLTQHVDGPANCLGCTRTFQRDFYAQPGRPGPDFRNRVLRRGIHGLEPKSCSPPEPLAAAYHDNASRSDDPSTLRDQ